MKITGIDYEKCTSCRECVKECPTRLFSEESGDKGRKIVFSDRYGNCIECGHCVAVCPHNAIRFEAADFPAGTPPDTPVSFPHIQDLSKIISFKDMLSFLQAKRSIRRFKPVPLPQEEIKAVLSAMQYAPSATNSRRWEYLVITNRETREFLTAVIVNLIKKVKILIKLKWILIWFLPKNLRRYMTNPGIMLSINKLIAEHEQGIDRIFYHAPCIIILHSPRNAHMSGNDAGIALTYGMLAAQARGLGTCWIGYAQEAFYMKKGLKQRMGIPKRHYVYGVVSMGYPDVTYHSVPPRGELKVRYIE